jgi:hypothetical protein
MATLPRGATADGLIVLAGPERGIAVIPSPTPLTRLNYFDGKFLRADDLRAEQDYVRRLVGLSNLGLAPGVIHGFDVTRDGDALTLGDGLAVDGEGRVLLLPFVHELSITELVERSRRIAPTADPGGDRDGDFAECVPAVAAAPRDVAQGGDLYLLTVGHAEALCGEEDVYGRLCEEACVTSRDRPYRIDGIVVRADPLTLVTQLPTSGAVALDGRHLRSRVACAFFADEQLRAGSLISRAGLALDAWCLGARLRPGTDVALAVFAHSGGTTAFLDAWTARRERIETPARRYWAGRMAMRPWDVFLAHVLQFQCQLAELLDGGGRGPITDPCEPQTKALRAASEALGTVHREYTSIVGALRDAGGEAAAETPVERATERIEALRKTIAGALADPAGGGPDRLLIHGGIVELPSAGYLPIDVASADTVNRQVRRLVGEGLDLRFCVVRPDFVAHALEEAQHMDRISLLQGLDAPADRPRVDVLVPEGRLTAVTAPVAGLGFDTTLSVRDIPSSLVPGVERRVILQGPGRAERLPGGGGAFHFAGPRTDKRGDEEPLFSFVSLTCDTDPFALGAGEVPPVVHALAATATRVRERAVGVELTIDGELRLGSTVELPEGGRRVSGTLPALLSRREVGLSDPPPVQSTQASVPFRMDLRPQAQPARIDILLGGGGPLTTAGGVTLAFVGEWEGRPLEVRLRADAFGADPKNPYASATLLEDQNALVAGGELHGAALAAIAAIASALDDAAFETTAAAKLFPAAAPTRGDEPSVRATRDWVLFHRRRDKECAVTEPPVTPAPTTCHTLYRVEPEFAERAEIALRRGQIDALLRREPPWAKRAGRVRFRAGSATLASPQAELESAWNVVGDNAPQHGWVLAPAGLAPDDPPLLQAQGTKLASLLGGGGTIDVVETVEPIPEGCAAATFLRPGPPAEPETICHRVYGFQSPGISGMPPELAAAISAGDLVQARALGVLDIGTVTFPSGQSTVSQSNVTDPFTTEMLPFVWHYDLTGTNEPVAAQSLTIADLIVTDASATARPFAGTATSVPDGVGCPIITLLILGAFEG